MPDAGLDRLDTAWQTWIDAQQAAIEIVRSTQDVPRTEEDLAEGFRWVTRLVSLAQEWFVEKSDPLHPVLFQLQDEYRKLLVDNPDVRYSLAMLDDRRSYRLVGTRGQAAYVGLTFGTPLGQGGGGDRTGTTVQTHLDAFTLGPAGQVELDLVPEADAPDPLPANTIALPEGTGQLAVRETFFDRRHEAPATLRIEITGPEPPPAARAEGVAASMEFAALFVQFVAATAVTMWRDTAAHVNDLGGVSGAAHVAAQEDEVRTHSNAEMTYHGGRWVLGENEALVVTVHEPPRSFLYWGLTTATAWMESLDYRYRTTSLNNRNAERSLDGNWRLVIAPTDPGVPNWIDTGGRRQGYMIVRWVLADDPPHPSCELVPVSELRARLGQTSEGTLKRS